MKEWVKNLDQISPDSGKYSQSYQDELLDVIFQNIGTVNPVPYCVEFGFNASGLEEGSGANVTRLILDKSWDALLLDGANENAAIHLHKHFLTSSNICDVFRKYEVPKEPEYISVDVDSTDLWLFEALLKEYRAMVFSVEYNSHFPLQSAITFPDGTDEQWKGDRAYGASLKALTMVAEAHGYSLLWVVPCLDAFFIRNDLIDDQSDEPCFPYEKWAPATGRVHHVALRDKRRAGLFLDYEVYCSTDGDLEASRTAALPVCEAYLTEGRIARTWWLVKALIKSVLGTNPRDRFQT